MTDGRVPPDAQQQCHDCLAVITGAGSGIGRSTADLFLRSGWAVIAIDKNETALADLRQHVDAALRPYLHTQPLDVSNAEDVQAWGLQLRTQTSAVHALINGAAVGLFARRMEDISVTEWEQVLATNLTGPFLMTQAVVPCMKRIGGHIINLSSVHAIATSFGMAAYASAKAGLIGLTRATALDYRADGIKANCLVIGSVDTPMSTAHRSALMAAGAPDLDIDPRLVAQPGEIAEFIRFLCSSAASFVNGAVLAVDGGLLAEL